MDPFNGLDPAEIASAWDIAESENSEPVVRRPNMLDRLDSKKWKEVRRMRRLSDFTTQNLPRALDKYTVILWQFIEKHEGPDGLGGGALVGRERSKEGLTDRICEFLTIAATTSEKRDPKSGHLIEGAYPGHQQYMTLTQLSEKMVAFIRKHTRNLQTAADSSISLPHKPQPGPSSLAEGSTAYTRESSRAPKVLSPPFEKTLDVCQSAQLKNPAANRQTSLESFLNSGSKPGGKDNVMAASSSVVAGKLLKRTAEDDTVAGTTKKLRQDDALDEAVIKNVTIQSSMQNTASDAQKSAEKGTTSEADKESE
uniref:Uncharacterized protein n=1 Tax=Kwoniella dejecticola CBS 10117 TaxID=1296121 RepID=A0A1A6ABR6_9TREE|nr:uncharacterized protein I303_01688 [Kwoniella dejecticola CBS 10117]OBR87483.1 hypothetical protein I303_01688 [Kwoniella dejecticola CBS 10117]